MAERTNKLLGNQEPEHAKESRGTATRLTDGARGSKKGLAASKPRGDKIAKVLVANDGKNPTLFSTLAMADLTTNLQGNREPLRAEETRTSKAPRTDYAREAQNGKTQGLASPKPSRNKIANKVTTNKKMDDRVWKGEQLNAACARMEKNQARGKPLRKHDDVTKAIVRVVLKVVAGVKKVIDTGKAFCCAPEPFDVDAFVVELPFPTRSEPTATLWAKVEV